jgi:hypothetical protein
MTVQLQEQGERTRKLRSDGYLMEYGDFHPTPPHQTTCMNRVASDRDGAWSREFNVLLDEVYLSRFDVDLTHQSNVRSCNPSTLIKDGTLVDTS